MKKKYVLLVIFIIIVGLIIFVTINNFEHSKIVGSFNLTCEILNSSFPKSYYSYTIYEIKKENYEFVCDSHTTGGCFGEPIDETTKFLISSKKDFENQFQNLINITKTINNGEQENKVDIELKKSSIISNGIYKNNSFNSIQELEKLLFD